MYSLKFIKLIKDITSAIKFIVTGNLKLIKQRTIQILKACFEDLNSPRKRILERDPTFRYPSLKNKKSNGEIKPCPTITNNKE